MFQFGGLNHLVQPPTSDVRIMSAISPENLRTSDCIHGVLVLLKHCHILTLRKSALKLKSITFMRWVDFSWVEVEDGWGRSGGFKPRCFFVDVKSVSKCIIYIYYVIQFAACFSDIILEVVSR